MFLNFLNGFQLVLHIHPMHTSIVSRFQIEVQKYDILSIFSKKNAFFARINHFFTLFFRYKALEKPKQTSTSGNFDTPFRGSIQQNREEVAISRVKKLHMSRKIKTFAYYISLCDKQETKLIKTNNISI